MEGVKEIEAYAFNSCQALSDVDFIQLEIIGAGAFHCCSSLRSISISSVREVGKYAFVRCLALTGVVFGRDLERIEVGVFCECTALRHIVIPLKDNLIIGNSAFDNCEDLSRVDILDEGIHETISSLHMEQWRNEMEEEIDRINQILPNTPAAVGKAGIIQQWITRVHSRMEHYKSEHNMLVKEAVVSLELALWKANLHENAADDAADAQEGVRLTRGRRKRARKDRCITSGASIVIKNVLPFLALE